MTRSTSPLRYPGGKTCLYGILSNTLRLNRLERGHYVEPYAGGCGLALSLLYGGHVSDIHVNDLDRSIWAFWYCVLNKTEEIVKLVEHTPVTIKEWHHQRNIQLSSSVAGVLELGFSTFFLNRTNRSGVIKGAGVIGGLSQKGNYKIDCRFNRDELIRRIRRIAKYKGRIHLTNLDAIQFVKEIDRKLPEDAFYCIDPPYFVKGSSLYTNFYGPDEHEAVAKAILKLKHSWIVTYDYAEEIRTLYSQRRQFLFDINYSIQTKRVGSELLIASKGLHLPVEIRKRPAKESEYLMAS
jgi:DNA adenine methylase